MNSESDFGESTPIFSYGMHFCPVCKNLMRPYTSNGELLDFLCDKCNRKYTIDYSKRTGEETLLYGKELQAGNRKFVPNLSYIFDPTMPNVEVECPECGFNRAVYLLTPDEGQTKLVAMMICASSTGTVAKCGHIWALDEDAEVTRTDVITEESKMLQNV